MPQLDFGRLRSKRVLFHTGAGQPTRAWPLERFRGLLQRLRALGCTVEVLCDPPQRDWWLAHGEQHISSPASVVELLDLLGQGGVFDEIYQSSK